jgi:hypothetical protein
MKQIIIEVNFIFAITWKDGCESVFEIAVNIKQGPVYLAVYARVFIDNINEGFLSSINFN